MEVTAFIAACVVAIVFLATRFAIFEFNGMANLCQDLAKDLANTERKLRDAKEYSERLSRRNAELSDTLDGIRAAMGIEE